jgi:hypothetical protein
VRSDKLWTSTDNKQQVRTFETGATRDSVEGKHDYEGFLSPLVLERFGEYMTAHRVQSDGSLRDSDNWQKGMPKAEYLKSAWRHFLDWWKLHRGYTVVDPRTGKPVTIEDALCAIFFNVQGYLHEILRSRRANQQSVTYVVAGQDGRVRYEVVPTVPGS